MGTHAADCARGNPAGWKQMLQEFRRDGNRCRKRLPRGYKWNMDNSEISNEGGTRAKTAEFPVFCAQPLSFTANQWYRWKLIYTPKVCILAISTHQISRTPSRGTPTPKKFRFRKFISFRKHSLISVVNYFFSYSTKSGRHRQQARCKDRCKGKALECTINSSYICNESRRPR